jgi:ABC-type transport system involved in multi-copper enzyme maturation permease subunit
MPGRELLVLLALTGLAAAGCTVLPGLAVWAAAAGRRLRGRPTAFPPLVGPLFAYELTRLARGGVMPRLRVLYAAVLLVGLLVAYLREFPDVRPLDLLAGRGELPLDRMSRFGQAYFETFLFLQLAALTLLAPVYAAGAVTDERDRGTLDHLRGSLLSNRELVAGKLAARLVFVLGVALTGLPVLAFSMLFGGVSGPLLVTTFAVAFASTLSLAAFGLWQATRCDTLRQVLVYAYSLAVVETALGGCCGCCLPLPAAGRLDVVSPLAFTARAVNLTDDAALVTGGCVSVALHGSAAAGFAFLATGGIRVTGVRRRPPPEPVRKPRWVSAEEPTPARPRWVLEPAVGPPHRRRERPPPRLHKVPRVPDDDPLGWKERYFSARLPAAEGQAIQGVGWAIGGGYLLLAGLGLFVAVADAVAKGTSPAPVVGPVFRWVAVAAVAAIPLLAGLRAAGGVVRERQRQTLDSLLTVPRDRAEMLAAKWKAAVRWAWGWLAAAAAVGAFALVVGAVHPFGLAVVIGLFAGAVPFATSFGLWLSVRGRTVARATTAFLVTALGLAVAPLLLGTLARSAAVAAVGEPGEWIGELFESASVPFAVWRAAVGYDVPDPEVTMLAGAAAAAGYGAAAWAFWVAARRRFEREGRD